MQDLVDYDIYKRKAIIGNLSYDVREKNGVRFDKDILGKLRPITKWDFESDPVDKNGAFVMYEEPPEFIPDGLYFVIYDPAKQSGDGESFHSILVYKYFYNGKSETLYDTIVAEWIGRKEKLDDNYEMVIKIAKYFNATIFPEINVAGFVEWCSRNDHYSMLESDAHFLEREINPNSKRSYYKVGFRMTGGSSRTKSWCTKRLANWLLDTKQKDPVTNVPILKTMDWIFSPRILDEVVNYDSEENFDHISCLLGLQLLLGKLDGENVPNVDEYEEEDYSEKFDYSTSGDSSTHIKARAAFLNY
jgi:hypothetical protein